MKTPYDVAIDSSGNLYIADCGNHRVLKETLSNGSYTQTVVASEETGELNHPAGVAVDSSGNVYIADYSSDHILKETPGESGYTESTIGSGMDEPFGVAVDAASNVYVADSGNGRILLETPSGGNYIQSTLVSELAEPFGVVVDAGGNLYIADRGANQVFRYTASEGGYTPSLITSNVVAPYKVIVDGSGNVYVADSYDHRILKEAWNSGSDTYSESAYVGGSFPFGLALDGSGNLYIANEGDSTIVKVQTTPFDFGSQPVLSTFLRGTFTFAFGARRSISPVVLTMGAVGASIAGADGGQNARAGGKYALNGGKQMHLPMQDFQDAGSGSCTNNGSDHVYDVGNICSVDVYFSPMYPGARNGAVELQDGDGVPLATAYVTGTGLAPRLGFIPGLQTTVATDETAGLSNPVGLALDGTGNLYVADWGNGRVIMLPMSDGGYRDPMRIRDGLLGPTGVAVDGAGNLYVAGYSDNSVMKFTLMAGDYDRTFIGNGTFLPTGVAVDGAGNVYVVDNGNNRALLETFAAGIYTQSEISSALHDPYGIALDGSGNVYIADQTNNQIVKNILSGGSYSQSTVADNLGAPQGVALDPAGNLYATDTTNNQIVMLPWDGSSYGTPVNFGDGLSSPQSLAFDKNGRLFIGDSWNNRIVRVDFSRTATLDFGAVMVGQSSAARNIVVANQGTSTMTFSDISATEGINLQTDCSVETPLAPGATCTLSVRFAPQAGGDFEGSVELDNDGVPGVAMISVEGVGQTDATRLEFGGNMPEVIANGGNPGRVTVNVVNGSGHTVNTSVTVDLQITGPAGFQTYNDSVSTVAGIATFDLTGMALTVTGNYTITASSSSGLASAQSSFGVSGGSAFGLSLGDDTMTVATGAAGTVNVTLTPTGGFAGDIALSCTNLPTYATCSFNPVSVHADGSNTPLSSVLSLSTRSSLIASKRGRVPALFACWSGAGLFGMLLFPASKGNRKRLWLIGAAVLLMVLAGCGSGRQTTPMHATVPGNYSVTVNATSGGVTHSTVLTVTVN